MSNITQNNEMEHISKEISLLQDRLKINKKSQSISKWVNANWKNTSKEGQRTNFSQTKKIQKILKYIFKNKIKHIKKGRSTKKYTCTCKKKERDYLKKD